MHVQFYKENDKHKWAVDDGKEGKGEVEKSGILARGNILSKKMTIKKNVLAEVRRQLNAEKEDRLLED